MRNLGELHALRSLGLDQICDQLLREDAVCREVIVVLLKSVERLGERRGQTLKLCLLLLGEVEEVEIVGAPAVFVGINLVLDTVETCHEDCGVAEIGVAGSVGVAKLEAALIGALCPRGCKRVGYDLATKQQQYK